MTDRSEQLRRRVASLRPDWDAAGLSGFLYLEGGYSNDNFLFTYQGERYVLRAPFRQRADVDRHAERDLYQAPTGLRTPELIAFDPGSGDMISRWVAGTLLADATVTGAALVDYLSNLHARLPALDRDYDPLAQARASLRRTRAPAWLTALAQRLTWRPAAAVSCHNDLNPWNVILTPHGDWVTLDWEWAGRNDPLFDLVTLHQGAALAAAELDVMARRYLGHAASAERLRACLTVFWLRETAWALAEVSAGNDRPEVLAQERLGLARLRALSAAG